MRNKSKPALVFLFSGQGSHYYHMGKELFENHSLFRECMLSLDRTARELLGESLTEKLYDPSKKKSSPFTRALHTNPIIFMFQYSLARVFMNEGLLPDYVFGSSLGEFVSTAVSGALPPEKVLETTIMKARAMEKHCIPGGMTAILSNPSLYRSEPILHKNSELAAVTFDSHFVVSGNRKNLNKIDSFLKEKEILYQKLPVSIAFHSTDMDPGRDEYFRFLDKLSFSPPEVSFISCCHARQLTEVPQRHLWHVGRDLIRFQETVKYMEKRGSCLYVDLGPSGVMANWTKYNLEPDSKSDTLSVLMPSGDDARRLRKALNELSDYKKTSFSKPLKSKSKMKTFFFPGQGSQSKGMGADLFEKYSDLTAKADEILGYSIKELCLEDSGGRLKQTQYTQPSLYLVNAFSCFDLLEKGESRPDFTCGHSLGEYNALLLAGAFDFETGLKLVKKRGALMAQASGGGMTAVIGPDQKELKDLLKQNGLEALDIANHNSPGQIVISGQMADLEKANDVFKKEKVMAIPLKVSAPFHSRYMKPAFEEFKTFLKDFKFSSLEIPVISNLEARPYPTKEERCKEILALQVVSPVLWNDSINYLLDQGEGETEFQEVGPGNVLTGLLRRIKKAYVPSPPEPKKEEPAAKPAAETPPAKPNISLKAEPKPETSAKVSTEKKEAKKSVPETSDAGSEITAFSLGKAAFREKFGLEYAYLGGGMYRGIASAELVVALGKAGMMSFFGSGGLALETASAAVDKIKRELGDKPFGLNMVHNYMDPEAEERLIDMAMNKGVRNLEAAAFMRMTPSLVRYRLSGLEKNESGGVEARNRIIGKISRPEVASAFLNPPPERIVKQLLEKNIITPLQAELGAETPMVDALCVEADSGGHTDQGVLSTLMPAVLALRDSLVKEHGYRQPVFVGSAGGIGSPEAAAAAFILGADFILTGSINQCTVEAGTSDASKDLLAQINVQDTDYAPAGDMFEIGAKVQVMKKGVFFPARGNRLYELYKQYGSLEEIDAKTRKQLEEKIFKKTFEEIYRDVKEFFQKRDPKQLEKAESNAKHKMALVFRWYFGKTSDWALNGETKNRVNFQIHTGPSLGSFNQWVKGSDLEDWRKRRVAEIGKKLMNETADLLNRKFEEFRRA